MYRVEVKNTDNANKFRQPAISFIKNGYYCPHPKGTTAYRRYWREQKQYCLEGFTSEEGEYVTGYFYFYLNFCPIIRVVEEEVLRNGKKVVIAKRERDFPLFYDYDRCYYDAIQAAEEHGKHLTVIKKRGAGYSFKGGSMLCRNYFLIPGSKSYAIASDMTFLTEDGLLSKAWEMMSFIDENTAWVKKRQKKNTNTHKRASFISKKDGNETEMGYMSEIIGVSLNNDFQKARGKRAKLILWEEAGKFPNLKEAWQIARPSVEEDGATYGLMVAYGTGGTMGADFEGLKDLFYEPRGYNCLSIENTWDDSMSGTECGFFVPQYYNMRDYMDSNGNSLIIQAREYEQLRRNEVITHASDRNSIDRYICERPFTPEEATLNISANIFPKKELLAHLNYIRTHESVRKFKQVGDLLNDSSGALKWDPSPKPKDITKYRLNDLDDKAGQVVIWEHPCENPPYGLYIMGCDPYDHDQASSSTSLGSVFVYKRFQTFEKWNETVVAEYTGRPGTVDEFYEIVRKLAIYYNAKILYENEKKGLFIYFSHKHCEYLLADQPNELIRDISQDSKVVRGKGIHMNKFVKQYMELRIKDWLNEEYEPGKKNLTKLLSEPLLEELIAYNQDGNFDRVISYGLCIMYREALYHIQVKENKQEVKDNKFFPEGLFKRNNTETGFFNEMFKDSPVIRPWR